MEHKGLVEFDVVLTQMFEPNVTQEYWQIHAVESFVFLARDYAARCKEDPDALCFDEVGIMNALNRFVRDAWGVKRFCERTEAQLEMIDQAGDAMKVVRKEIQDLGIKINTHEPRKTRIAAVFTLWMSTFRPIHIRPEQSKLATVEALGLFCFEFIFAVTIEYLKRFGQIKCGVNVEDEKVRIDHVVHDLHCRALTLSPLELLYCSIFRPLR